MGMALAATLAACGSTSDPAPATTDAAAPASSPAVVTWKVDTSGWWVPEDPTGCLQETVTCYTSVWKTREYKKGNLIFNLIQHGEEVTLICKAPTPVPLRNSLKTESVSTYYIEFEGKNYWLPDVYAAKDDAQVQEMGADVPTCDSDTPGVNGSA